MSYCRFGTDVDGEKSDIYMYASWDDPNDRPMWTICVAYGLTGEEPRGLPFAGEHYNLYTGEDALDKLLELREIGYRVPQEATSRMYNELLEDTA